MEPSAPRSGSALAQLGNIFVAPAQALDYAGRRPRGLVLPLGLTLALNALFGFWYAFSVNVAAWRAAMIQIAATQNPEAASRVAEFYGRHGRDFLVLGAAIGVVWLAVIELLFALYLFLADKLFSADSQSYGRWLSFTSWTWMPVAVGFVAAIIAWAVGSHGAQLELANITSLNSLLFHLAPHDRLFKLAQFSVMQFWVIGLVTYGLVRWRRHSVGKALAIALAPYVVVYGILFLL